MKIENLPKDREEAMNQLSELIGMLNVITSANSRRTAADRAISDLSEVVALRLSAIRKVI